MYMILFSVSLAMCDTKHSTSVPFSAGVAVPVSVDEKKGPLVPNPVPGIALKALFGPQIVKEEFDL